MIKLKALTFLDLELIYRLGLEHNLSVVARQMFTSQPAASQRLQGIRQKLDNDIFILEGKRWDLTEEGQLIADYYQQILDGRRQTEIRIENLSSDPSGDLLIGTSDTLGIHLLPPILDGFSRRFPNIHLQLTSKPSRVVASELLAGKMDIGIALASAAEGPFNAAPLFRREEVLIASPQSRYLRKRQPDAADFNHLPMIVLDKSSQSRHVVESWFRENKTELHLEMEMGSIEMIKAYVIRGFGLAIVPRISVEREIADGLLTELPLPESYPRQEVVMFYPANRYQKKISRLFANYVLHYFEANDKGADKAHDARR
jgi:DNA-binding transcriptional LysR family regulator